MPRYGINQKTKRLHRVYESWVHCKHTTRDKTPEVTTMEAARHLKNHPDSLCRKCFPGIPLEIRREM